MPFKIFANNALLTAAEVNDYLMKQSVVSVANVSDMTAISSPPNGMHVFVTGANGGSLYARISAAWVRIGGSAINGVMRRTTATLQIPNGAYGNISTNSGWSSSAANNGEMIGGMTYNNGFVIPAPGLYLVEWQLLLTGTNNGIIGIAQNASGVPGGQLLHAASTVQNAGAIFGGCSAQVRCAAGDVLTLWGYGNGGVLTVNNIAGSAPHWAALWVAP